MKFKTDGIKPDYSKLKLQGGGVAHLRGLIDLKTVRRVVADYVGSEGCSCCEDDDHDEHKVALATLLNVPKYKDGSGYNFRKFRAKKTT